MKTIFVSSTFKDMQDERNLIHTQVMPSVNYELKEIEDYANFLDFRWGIDTNGLSEKAALKKVLSACFDAINNSNYFIVFVGDNYGSCVPHVIIDELERQHHFIKKGSNKSITELEIDCAVSNNSLSMDNIFFYFRNENYTNQDDRVNDLKRKIINNYPTQIRYYSTVNEDLAELIKSDVLSWFKVQENSLGDKSSQITADHLLRYSCRQETLYDATCAVIKNTLTIVHGESGSGKSVFMSALENQLSKKCHTKILYVNKTVYHGNVSRILWDYVGSVIAHNYPNHKLNRDCFGQDYEKQLTCLFSLIDDDPSIKDYVFLIDGIDKLNSSDATKALSSLKNISKKLHFVISLDMPEKYIYLEEPYFIQMSRLCNEDKKKIVYKELEINHKTLSESSIDLLLQKRDSGLPLYLVLAIKRLIHMQEDDYTKIYDTTDFSESINSHIVDIINDYSEDIENMIIDYIEFSEKLIEREHAINIVSFLAASAYGFSDFELYFLIEKYNIGYLPTVFLSDSSDIRISYSFRDNKPLRLLSGSPIKRDYPVADFYLFCKYLGDLLNVNPCNGKISFDNLIVRRAIIKLYHGNVFLDAISNEMHYDGKDKVLSDYEICNCALRTTFFKRGLVDPYKRLIVNVWTYPPFHLINSFMKSNKSDQLELLALVLFDLLAYDGINLLRSYLNQAFSFLRKRSYDKEEPLNSIRFIVKYIFPKISESMLNPIEYVPVFEACLVYLRKHMDYSIIDNRLYLTMARLNIAIMCYNASYTEKAKSIAKQCKLNLNAMPLKMRNGLYYDALKTYSEIVQTWGV